MSTEISKCEKMEKLKSMIDFLICNSKERLAMERLERAAKEQTIHAPHSSDEMAEEEKKEMLKSMIDFLICNSKERLAMERLERAAKEQTIHTPHSSDEMTEEEKKEMLKSMIDFLICNSKERLSMERAERKSKTRKMIHFPANDVIFETEFTGWAARAKGKLNEARILDKNKIFTALFFSENGNQYCEISVRNTSEKSIERFANKKACLIFKDIATFEGEFDQNGIMLITLDQELPLNKKWYQISFSLQLKNHA